MRLSRESRYAITALVVMAGRPAGQVLDSRQVAQEADLPAAYLAKILRQLVPGGVLRARRGLGYELARPPAEITLRQILDAIEGPGLFEDRCIFWREVCSSIEPCPLHFRWKDLKPAIEDSFSDVTLEDIRREGGIPLPSSA